MDTIAIADIKSALRHVPADDRDTWVRLGMACHSLGEDLFDVWDAWSRTSEAYDERAAISVWKSFKPGAIGVGTLFRIARQHGWTPGVKFDASAYRKMRASYHRRLQQQQASVRREQAMITEKAKRVLQKAELGTHSYISRKGFPDTQMLISKGKVLVPMRDVKTNDIISVQSIDEDGNKRFLSGGRKKDTMFRLGRGREIWMCEGLATALSLQHALNEMQRKEFSVVITFDAYNFVTVAQSMVRGKRGVAVADNDPWKCHRCKHRWNPHPGAFVCPECNSTQLIEPVGVTQARKTMLPVFVPSLPGDVNDMHMEHGIEKVCDELREFLGIGVDSQSHGSCSKCGGTTMRRSGGNGYDARCILCGTDTYMPL